MAVSACACGGSLSCDELREEFDAIVADAQEDRLACTADTDCGRVYAGLSCHGVYLGGCAVPIRADGVGIRAEIEADVAVLCEAIDSECDECSECMWTIPLCPGNTPVCVEGQCTFQDRL